MKSLILALACLMGSYVPAMAGQIPDDMAVRAIIGEDSSSEQGMLAVAHAIRNRGTLKGVYGLQAVRWDRGHLKRYHKGKVSEVISGDVYQLACKAWANSEDGRDITGGATHWEGVKFKRPYWAGKMVDCGVFGENRFYRDSNKHLKASDLKSSIHRL